MDKKLGDEEYRQNTWDILMIMFIGFILMIVFYQLGKMDGREDALKEIELICPKVECTYTKDN